MRREWASSLCLLVVGEGVVEVVVAEWILPEDRVVMQWSEIDWRSCSILSHLALLNIQEERRATYRFSIDQRGVHQGAHCPAHE